MNSKLKNPKFKRRRSKSFSIPQADVFSNPSRPQWLEDTPRQIDLVFLDFETTGGNPLNSSLIEIGAIRYSKGVEVGRLETLINPGRPVPHIVQKITGITDEILADAPRIEEVFPYLIQFIGDAVVVAHGAQGDVSYLVHLSKELLQTEFHNFYFCTHLLVHHYLPQIPSKTLSGIAEYFGLDFSNAHTAISDAEMTAGVFWKFYELCEKGNLQICSDLFKLQGDFETLKKLGPGINPIVVDSVTTAPGVVYLLDTHYEISYLTAAVHIKKELRKLTEMGNHRDMNQIIVDAAYFKFSRSYHYLAALIYEKKELQKISLKIDPRKFHHRSENFIQVLIPDDLKEKFQISEVLLDLDDFDHSHKGTDHESDLDSPDSNKKDENSNEHQTDGVEIPLKKSRKANAFVRSTKYQQNRHISHSKHISVGNLKEGLGYYFGPFDSPKQVAEQLEKLVELFPFEHKDHSDQERLLHLRILVAFLSHEINFVLGELKGTNSAFSFLKQMQNARVIKNIAQVLDTGSCDLISKQVPRSGLAVISVNEIKEFEIYVIVKGEIANKVNLPFEQSDKLSNSRFITRLFEKHIQKIQSAYVPMMFTENACSDVELFCHWLANKRGEGEFVDFDQLENLFDLSVLE